MIPNNVHTFCLSGSENAMYKILFQCALHWAEFGETVWFISPKPIDSLPNCWKQPPDKEILKLIFFIYIQEPKDLVVKLSEVHLVPKIPKIIIIKDFDYYLNPNQSNFNIQNSAFIAALLLDAASVYAEKFEETSFACVNLKSKQNIQNILDLYFLKQLNISNDSEDHFNSIVEIFKTKKTES